MNDRRLLTRLAAASILLALQAPLHAATQTAVFAGGCFWCVESDFDQVKGVLKTVSGYGGGSTPNPTYESVSASKTNHLEVVEVTYDDTMVSYTQLVNHFWKTIDPTNKNGQFCDSGPQYRSAILYASPEQKRIAEQSKADLINSKKLPAVYTEVAPLMSFYAAEEYHQDYYKKNPVRYKFYRSRCGRDQRTAEVWGR